MAVGNHVGHTLERDGAFHRYVGGAYLQVREGVVRIRHSKKLVIVGNSLQGAGVHKR